MNKKELHDLEEKIKLSNKSITSIILRGEPIPNKLILSHNKLLNDYNELINKK